MIVSHQSVMKQLLWLDQFIIAATDVQDYGPSLFCSYAAHLATQLHYLSYAVVYHPTRYGKYELNMRLSQTVFMCICQLVLGLNTCLLYTLSSKL
jgi:hypothetical protein